MTSYAEKAKEAVKYIDELEKLRKAYCKLADCKDCPLYGYNRENLLNACLAIYHLRNLFM